MSHLSLSFPCDVVAIIVILFVGYFKSNNLPYLFVNSWCRTACKTSSNLFNLIWTESNVGSTVTERRKVVLCSPCRRSIAVAIDLITFTNSDRSLKSTRSWHIITWVLQLLLCIHKLCQNSASDAYSKRCSPFFAGVARRGCDTLGTSHIIQRISIIKSQKKICYVIQP